MGEPMELHDIVGGTVNDDSENAYEIPQASTDEGRYENLRINTGDGPAAGSNIVSDTDTNKQVEDNNHSVSRLNCVKHISAVRQLQMICGVLFTIVIICSVTIGVLINKLDSRMSAVEFDRHTLLLAIESNEKRFTSKVNGHWADWSFWSSCSVTCGSGQQTRQRSCSNPSPVNGGQICPGSNTEQMACQAVACPVNGGWSSWSSWSACSKTCNIGQKRRSRTCNNPAPIGFGRDCSGNSDEISVCNETLCSVNENWADWSFWSSCSVTCGSGQQTRQRSCSNPSPVNGGSSCPGSNTEQMACQTVACSVNGGWSSWSTWIACSKTCGTGQKRRSRTCNNPTPTVFGRDCSGNSDEISICNETPCPDPVSAFAIFGATPTYNSSSRVAVFRSTRLNIGNHYSTVTGQYTCYYPGLYVFSLNLYKKTGASRINCHIRKNGSGYVTANVPSESQSGYYESSASTIFHLNRGDTVYVGGCYNPDDIDSYTSFTGFLLKAD